MDKYIVADSSCEFTEEMKKDDKIIEIPFKIDIDNERFIDDGSIDIDHLLKKMKDFKGIPKTAAPSPGDFLAAFEKGKEVFAITISSALSATYSNAVLAKKMAEEKGSRLIHVFDSKSASSGETLVALKIREYIENGLEFDEIVEKVESFISKMKTVFVLDSIDNLLKNGRMSKITGFIANVLSIKPVLIGDENGEINLLAKARGIKNARAKLVEIIGEDKDILKEKTMVITYCNSKEAAEDLKREIEQKYGPKEIYLIETGGLSSVYADDGGIVISYR
ncbi:MAG: DegV family protein [Tissierellia bacterium]|nr:DegV family protein [Tissierellia bacterium]